MEDKILLNVEETARYLNISKNKAREILNSTDSKFTVRIGRRIYAHKESLDKYLEQVIKYQIEM